MSKITEDMWKKAISKAQEIICNYLEYYIVNDYVNVFLAGKAEKLTKLRHRYKQGERSTELYNAIMELC